MKLIRYVLLAACILLLGICVIRLHAEPKQFFEDNSSVSREELLRKGNSFISRNMPDSALAYLTLAARGYNAGDLSAEEQRICANALTSIGYIHFFFYNDYPAAYSALISSNDLAKKNGLSRIQCINDINIGNIYSINKDYETASKMYKRAFESARRNGHKALMMISFVDIADIYFNEKGETAPMRKEIKAFGSDSIPVRHPLSSYSRNIYRGLKAADSNDSSAVKWFDRARNSVGDIHLRERYVYNADFLASRMLQKEGQNIKAAEQMKKIITDSAISANRDVEAMAYKRISECYRDALRFDSAQLYKIKYLELSDSIFATQKMSAVKDLEASHQRQEFSSELLRMTDAHRFQRRLITVICIALSLVIGLLIWIILKNKQLNSRNEELFKRNQELLRIREKDPLAGTAADSLPPKTRQENKGILSPDSDFLITLKSRILEVMASEEIFSPDFNSARLASLCNTNTRYISAALSGTEPGNLPALLAEFRVREAMRRLSDLTGEYSNLTIEAIGESVGFKSRGTFSIAFKKCTGMTPKEYRRMSATPQD